jgi:hypothetical protein
VPLFPPFSGNDSSQITVVQPTEQAAEFARSKVTTSMAHNSAKGNWTLAKLRWTLKARGDFRAKVRQRKPWEEALAGIKGIGPWTLSVFRIMVLRHPDELPSDDVGLERAVTKVYGRAHCVQRLGETWRPFRSIAC